MQDRTLCLVLLGAVLNGMCHGAPLITDEVLARNFLDKTSTQLHSYYEQLVHDTVNIGDNDPEEAIAQFLKVMTTAEALVSIVNESKAYDYSQFKDKQLKYTFKILRKSAEAAIVGSDETLLMLTSIILLEGLSSSKDIEGYHDKSLKLAYYPEIQKIFAKSNSTDELVYYWNVWRTKNDAGAKEHFANIVHTLRKAAKLTDMTPYDFWMGEHNITEMENVMTQIEPLYKQLHAFIRKQLLAKYGDQAIKPDGPIPDHLFQQVLAQAWTNGSIIDEMYPHQDLPPYDSILKKNKYDTAKLYKTADKFYQSLGFEPIPDSLWDTQIKMNKDEDEGDCKAAIFDLTSNVYMHYCQKMDFRKFLQAHGYMGQLYYAREKKALPAYYFPAYDLEFPIGEAVVLSASTPKHLKAIGMVTDFQFTDQVLMNRLLRMGIHTLLNIPVFFVHTKVMADLFADVVSIDQLNKHYWKLMGQYVGVEPPVDRDTNFFDFPFKFYIDLNENTQAKKFNTEVLGYQFYQKFCEISRQYPSEPLHSCDFYDNTSVGDAMKKMMKLGSSKELPEVLAALLPENPSANAASLLEYYQPIKTWLTDKNREANVKTGWTPSDKKIV